MTWVFILMYLGFQLLLGIWISRKMKSETDFFLGGRNLPLYLVSFSLFATWFGAETCIGSAGAVYANGLSGSRADPFGYSICLLLVGLLMAAKLWKGGYITLADFYRERYGRLIEKVTIWVLVPSSLIWAAAQIRAFGQVVSATTPLDVTMAISVSAVFVIAYTLMGGLLGDIITDLIQGGILLISLGILLVFALPHLGDLNTAFAEVSSERLSFIAPGESFLTRMDRWMVPILGSLVAQELISRVLASKNASVARKAGFVSCGIYLFAGAIPVVLGLVGPKLLPGITDQEQFLPLLAETILPPFLYVIFAGALISAILSTIDSILLSVAALVSHNMILPMFNITSEKGKLRSARLVVAASGILAFLMALYAEGIYELVETASSFGTAGLLVITLLGLYFKVGGETAALAAILSGALITPLGRYVWELEAPFITSILGAFGFYFVGDLLAKRLGLECSEGKLSLPWASAPAEAFVEK